MTHLFKLHLRGGAFSNFLSGFYLGRGVGHFRDNWRCISHDGSNIDAKSSAKDLCNSIA